MATEVLYSSPSFLTQNSQSIISLGELLKVNPYQLSCIVNSSICALWKLTQQSLTATPCYKLLNLSIRGGQSVQACDSVNARVMRELLRQTVANSSPSKKGQQPLLHQASEDSGSNSSMMSVFSSEVFKEILKQYFFRAMHEVLISFSCQYSSRCGSKLVQFTWRQDMYQKLFQQNYGKVLSCKNVQQIYGMTKNGCSQVIQNSLSSRQEDKQILYFKLLLLKLDGSAIVKHQLYKLFSQKCGKAKLSEKEIQKWMNCSNNLDNTVRLQMKELEAQTIQNSQLQQVIQNLSLQLCQAESRLIEVQAQVMTLEQQLAQIKQPIIIQEPAEGYYINPHFQKSQYEQKLFMEMVEAESELLIGKEQIKLMTDSIVDLIKVSRNSLEDLQASKYFLSSFNKSVLRILKDVKSLEYVDLEGLLSIKQDSHSIYDSECFEETRKSELSTFSEIEIDQKMSRYTEDDTLSLTNNDQ